MRKIFSSKRLAALAVAAVAVTGTGVAFAFWTSDGTGTGSGSVDAGNAAAFSVSGDAPDAMYPGDAAQTVTATVTNTDADESYKVEKLEAYITTAAGANCDGSNFLLNGNPAPSTAATAVDLNIVPTDLVADGTKTVDYTLQFNNKETNQDLCKNAAVTVHYIAS